MGNKVWVVGLTVLLAVSRLVPNGAGIDVATLGAIIAIFGAILIVLDR